MERQIAFLPRKLVKLRHKGDIDAEVAESFHLLLTRHLHQIILYSPQKRRSPELRIIVPLHRIACRRRKNMDELEAQLVYRHDDAIVVI